jgi:SEC-C motif-containing protein
MKKCPCGQDVVYEECCGKYISGAAVPATPEELMRSRYTAYTKANINYIVATMKSPASDDYDADDARRWARSLHWLGLQVLHTSTENTTGYVEFIATYLEHHIKEQIHELSEFHLIDGRWYYIRAIDKAQA